MSSNSEDIRNYLLGKLEPAERERLDLRIIEDEEFGIEALAAEDALIESYADGELSDADAKLFRENYLTTEARANRVKEFMALRGAVSRSGSVTAGAREEKQKQIVGFFGRFGLMPAMAGLVVFLMLGFGAWMYLSKGGQTELERQYTALNRVDMSDLSQFDSLSTVELVPGTMRGAATGSKVVVSQLSDPVLFRFQLAFDPGAGAVFDVALAKDGRDVFAVKQIRTVNDSRVNEVRVRFPRQVINSGQYQVRLSRPDNQFAPVMYNFTAE